MSCPRSALAILLAVGCVTGSVGAVKTRQPLWNVDRPRPDGFDACACISTQQVFKPLPDGEAAKCNWLLSKEMCQGFLQQLPDEKMCMIWNKQWANTPDIFLGDRFCFVPRECSHPLAVEADWAEGAIKMRPCAPQEPYIGDKSIEELMKFSETNNLDAITLLKNTYPTITVQDHPEWKLSNVMAHWNISSIKDEQGREVLTAKKLEPKTTELFEAFENANRTLFIDNKVGPPYLLLQGKQAYWMNHGVNKVISYFKTGQTFKVPTSSKLQLGCVHGCEQTAEPWWSPLNKRQQLQKRWTDAWQ